MSFNMEEGAYNYNNNKNKGFLMLTMKFERCKASAYINKWLIIVFTLNIKNGWLKLKYIWPLDLKAISN